MTAPGPTSTVAERASRFQNDTDRVSLNSIYTYGLFPWFGPYVARTVDRVRLGGALALLQLKEGPGGNFRVLRSIPAELDLRVGLGARQTFARGLFVFEDGAAGMPGRLVPVSSTSLVGLESTVVGLFWITRYVTLTTELEGLAPFGGEAAVFTWRNQARLRLGSFASLVYRFNVVRDPNLGIGSAPSATSN